MPVTFHGGHSHAGNIGSLLYKLLAMKQEPPRFRQSRLAAAVLCPAGALLVLLSTSAAQDIRGMERCTAETRMDRRTGCLQANVEFLQQALLKLAREMQDKIAATDSRSCRSPSRNRCA